MALARSTGRPWWTRNGLSVREPIERFEAKPVLSKTLGERLLVKVDSNKAKEDLFNEQNKGRGEERLKRMDVSISRECKKYELACITRLMMTQ